MVSPLGAVGGPVVTGPWVTVHLVCWPVRPSWRWTWFLGPRVWNMRFNPPPPPQTGFSTKGPV